MIPYLALFSIRRRVRVMSREVKIVECKSCGKEMRVEIAGVVDSSRLKCANCRAIESKESVERLIRVIFNP